jgi:hypothetical protein
MKIITLIFALIIFSLPVFSKNSDYSDEHDENIIEKKEADLRYGGGIGFSLYDTIEGKSKPCRGNYLYFSWSRTLKSNRLTLRESSHGLQVLTPINVKKSQRNWDVEFSWDEWGYSNKMIDIYFSPIVGGKVKEKLTVTCKKQSKVCFDSYIDSWKIIDKKQELRPLVGLNSGVRFKLFHVVVNNNLFIKTDFEDTYYGIEISLGGQQ